MSLKHDRTSTVLEHCIAAIDSGAPINVSFLTQPLSTACIQRIKSLEQLYSRSSLYRFLMKKGVSPTLLFSSVTSGIGYGLYRTYTRSTKLALNLLGVLYPTYCCWRLIRSRLVDGDEQLKAWLTYWMIFGTFKVLDHWMASDLFMFSRRKYNLYKLFILYWAQSPHSKGALLLYRHVIQKPDTPTKDTEQQSQVEQLSQVEQQNQVEQSIRVEEQAKTAASPVAESYRFLDGFQPPNLNISNSTDTQHGMSRGTSCGSEDLDSLKYHHPFAAL